MKTFTAFINSVFFYHLGHLALSRLFRLVVAGGGGGGGGGGDGVVGAVGVDFVVLCCFCSRCCCSCADAVFFFFLPFLLVFLVFAVVFSLVPVPLFLSSCSRSINSPCPRYRLRSCNGCNGCNGCTLVLVLTDDLSLPSTRPVDQVGMVGDAQVGKTTLMVKYVENKFDEEYIMTLGGIALASRPRMS